MLTQPTDTGPASRKPAHVLIVGDHDVAARTRLAAELGESRYRITLARASSAPGDSADADGILTYGLSRPLTVLGRPNVSLAALVTEVAPDLVHVFGTVPGLAAGDTDLGVPVVKTVTGRGTFGAHWNPATRVAVNAAYRHLQGRGRSRIDHWVFQNRSDQDWFLSRGLCTEDDSTLILGSGFVNDAERTAAATASVPATRAQLGFGPDDTIVLMASRLLRQKGVGDFLAVAKRLAAPDRRFVLVGPRPAGPRSVSRRALRRAGRYVTVLPAVDGLDRLLAASDLFVLPTRYGEGIARVLMEACAVGTPVVTTDMPGCRDVIRDGHNGRVVPPGSFRGLMAAVDELLVDRRLRREYGANARATLDPALAIEGVARQFAAVYERVLHPNPAPASTSSPVSPVEVPR